MTTDKSEEAQFTLALFDQQPPEILKKPVQAVHMVITGGVRTKTQLLAWNAMLKNAHEFHERNPGVSVDTYSISRVELMQMIDYRSPNRKHLKEALTKMQDLKVEWDILKQDGDTQWASCVLLPFIAFDRDKVYYSYTAQIKPLLLDPKTYSRVDIRIQRSFRLDCAVALYEWVNRFRHNPSKRTTELPWEDWRWAIYGAIEEKSILHEYKMFKREKLKPAILEINEKSDLQIELLENKDGGRSIKRLQFIVTEKPFFKIEAPDDSIKLEWEKRLEDLGVTARTRKKLFAHYPIDVIEAHHNYTVARIADTSQTPLKNVGAYLVHAIENRYAWDMIKREAEKVENPNAMADINAHFMKHRSDEAEAMFNEMSGDARELLVHEFNALQSNNLSKVPEEQSKRVRRHMAAFYGWLANKTWGEPTAQDIVEHALKSGMLTMPSPTAPKNPPLY
jgi:plasmid replication initiation protein